MTKLQKAEKASADMLKEVLEARERARHRWEELEHVWIAKEERRDELETERNQRRLGTMAQMMTMMSQFMGASIYPPPVLMWDMSYVNNAAFAAANFDLRILAYISYRGS